MKRLLAIIVMVVLLGTGCAKKKEATKAATFIPSNAVMYVSMSLDPSAEQKRNLQNILKRFPDLEAKEDFGEMIDELLTGFFEDPGLDWKKDIKPWAGKEIAIAVVPPPSSEDEPGFAVLIEATDTGQATAAIDKAKEAGDFTGGYKVVEPYVVIVDEGETKTNDALLAKFAAPEGDKQGLAGKSSFSNLVADVHEDRLLTAWMDFTALAEAMGEGMGFPIPGFDTSACPGGDKGDAAMAFALYADPDTFALEGVTNAETAESESGSPKLTPALPADTTAALTLFGLRQTYEQQIKPCFGAQEEDFLGGFLNDMKEATGIDLEADLISWMGGEFVLSVGTLSAEGFPEVGLVIEPTDKAKAEAGMGKIKGAVETALQGPLSPITVGGATGYAFPEAPEPGLRPAMVLLPDRFVVATTPDYLTKLSAAASPGFGSSVEYKEATRGAEKVGAQLVVRLGAVGDLIGQFVDPAEAKKVEEIFDHLQALLVRAGGEGGARIEIKVVTK